MEFEKGENNENDNDECTILHESVSIIDHRYKIIIIGDAGVGKTCLTVKLSSGKFEEKSSPTLGFDYSAIYLKYKGKILKIEIWDTCGQETYRSLVSNFYVHSSLAVVVYAIDEQESFNSIEEWLRQVKNHCSPETKIVLIGNKADLDDQ
jgi:small GTP-binding protein